MGILIVTVVVMVAMFGAMEVIHGRSVPDERLTDEQWESIVTESTTKAQILKRRKR